MKNPVFIVFLSFFFLVFDVPYAEEGTSEAEMAVVPDASVASIPSGMEGKITLDLRNIEVVEALKFLAMKVGLNIIATKNVTGRVSLMVDNASIKDVFDIMLRSNGLAYAKQGDIYNIMTEDEYKAIFGRRFADIRAVKVFRIKYAIPDQVFSLFDALKSDIGRVLVEPDSGTALIMDTPEKIAVIEDAMKAMEQKNLLHVFPLKFARAKEIEEQLKSQLDAKKVGSVKADERSNQIIVQTLPDRMKDIEKLVKSLDKKTKEVLIEAKIIKIKLTDSMNQGFSMEGLFKVTNSYGMTYLGSYPFSVLQAGTAAWQSRQKFASETTGMAYPFGGNTASVNASTPRVIGDAMHVGAVSSSRDYDTIITYLQSLGNTQILSNPKLAVINNHEAKIHVGEKQAYVTSTTTTGQTTTTVSEEVTFVDVGIQLSVTPTINDEGYVTMKIKPEVSSVVSTLTTPSGNKIPIIDTSMAETTVMIKNGTTIIIGGLRKLEKTSTSDRVPFLGQIPLLGFLFRNKSDATQRTELLVILTPTIIEGDRLETGDDRGFGDKPGKPYTDYPGFNAESEFQMPEEKPEEKMKPYRDYNAYKQGGTEPAPQIKGETEHEIKS